MTPLSVYQCAQLAQAAEAMYAPGMLEPPLPNALASMYDIAGYAIGGVAELTYYGFVAIAKATGERILVFRGTENATEWMEDAQFNFVPYLGSSYKLVEAGFYAIFASLNPWKTLPVFDTVVGHSLGAPLAAYAFLQWPRPDKRGVLFACPRPGNQSFSNLFDNRVAVYNYTRDMVPRIPFGFGYADLPNVTWLRPTADIFIEDNVISNHRIASYLQLVKSL